MTIYVNENNILFLLVRHITFSIYHLTTEFIKTKQKLCDYTMEKYNKQNKNYVTTQWRNIINKKNISTQHRNIREI